MKANRMNFTESKQSKISPGQIQLCPDNKIKLNRAKPNKKDLHTSN